MDTRTAEQIVRDKLLEFGGQAANALANAAATRDDEWLGVQLAIAAARTQQFSDTLFLTDEHIRQQCSLPPNVSIKDMKRPIIAKMALHRLLVLNRAVRKGATTAEVVELSEKFRQSMGHIEAI